MSAGKIKLDDYETSTTKMTLRVLRTRVSTIAER